MFDVFVHSFSDTYCWSIISYNCLCSGILRSVSEFHFVYKMCILNRRKPAKLLNNLIHFACAF